MFQPKFTITPRLLENIKKIALIISDLNRCAFPRVVLMELERKANSLSAYASTSIEGNPLPLTEVKRILKTHPRQIRDSEREVLNYNKALQDLNELIRQGRVRFDRQFVLKVHSQIMSGLLDKFRCGKLRKEPVFVNDPKSRKPVYLPPDHGDVPGLMDDLVDFVKGNDGKIDPLIVSGIYHKQFVIIHPFIDGNGRTARLTTKALLAQMGLNTFNLFSFENYYNANVSRYFQRVGVSGNYYEIAAAVDFTEWLEYFTEGIIDELLRVEKELKTVSVTPETALKPYHLKIVGYIKEHGYITDADYGRLVKRAKATRNLDFKKLLDMKIIERLGKGKSTYYKLRQ